MEYYPALEVLKLTTRNAHRDYYGILGINRKIDEEGIRRAYVQRAWELHPDVNPDVPEAASRMSAVNEAYGVLSDPARRAIYDTRQTALNGYVSDGYIGTSSVSYVRRRRSSRQSGISKVMLVMSRLMRCVTAILTH